MPIALGTRLAELYARWSGRLIAVAGVLAVGGLILLEGFLRPPLPPGLLACAQVIGIVLFAVVRLMGWLVVRDRRAYLREHGLDLAVVLAMLVIWRMDPQSATVMVVRIAAVYIAAVQVLSVMQWLVQGVSHKVARTQAGVHPARLMVAAFALVILLGTGLLLLPKAAADPVSGQYGLHAVNCLFTATSATCVTGLVVYDTGTQFSRFGQVVILLLMQAGGLGIVFFGTLLGVLLGRQMSLQDSALLQDALGYRMLGQIGRLVRFIVLTTLAIEVLGALLLVGMYRDAGMEPQESWFQAAFHSVSAFCNAGFCLSPDGQSLIIYRHYWHVYVVVAGLILLGGLGFPVLSNLWAVATRPLRSAWLRLRDPTAQPQHVRLSLQTKLVLTTSAVLLVLGVLLLFVSERHWPEADTCVSGAAMCRQSTGMRLASAWFQSVTARTAGFNTVALDESSMSMAGHFVLCLLMFVGGSPVSTAGGVKTATVAVLLLSLWATIRRRDQAEAFRRAIPFHYVRRAGALVFLFALLVAFVVLMLCFTEADNRRFEGAPPSLRSLVFESVSACGTVGLSTGITPRLTVAGKLMVTLAMFCGRLGPLTFFLALVERERPARYAYPAEAVALT
jgi:trk system potassium uptake protein TrkH